jgi:hypothetical protein
MGESVFSVLTIIERCLAISSKSNLIIELAIYKKAQTRGLGFEHNFNQLE